LSDPVAAVPQAIAWNCAQPAAEDAGQWAVVSANMFLDFRRCTWLASGALELIGGGSMYAVRLPAPIPATAFAAAAPPGYAPRALYREAVRNPKRTSEILDELEVGANPSARRRMR
jgi:hypothetical protein